MRMLPSGNTIHREYSKPLLGYSIESTGCTIQKMSQLLLANVPQGEGVRWELLNRPSSVYSYWLLHKLADSGGVVLLPELKTETGNV